MADEKQRTWNEAPASWNIRYRVNGFDEQITLRGDTYHELQPTIDAARAYVGKLIGAAPSAKSTSDALNVEPSPPDLHSVPQAQPQQAAAHANGSVLTFSVERIEANVNGGKVSWRVKGGQFAKFGVIAWPEVVAAAGLKLDPNVGAYSLTGWSAEYTLKEDGKPQKVTRLYQVQG